MAKCSIVDFWGFFKNKTDEIRHLDSRRHFELYFKNLTKINEQIVFYSVK
jgi:hypothetical protein